MPDTPADHLRESRSGAAAAEEIAGLVETKPATGSESRGTNQSAASGTISIAPNYQYWRDHGTEWADEYDNRKKDQPYYHIQELMLTDYIRGHAPVRVLEYGCGVGRHLRNLSQIPGVEVYGFDQSPAMVSQFLRWTTQEWVNRRVTLGNPTGRIRFEDGEFDIVYTAEVLVHVRPEDLSGVLSELLRVARWQVFHLETSPTYQLVGGEHDGCWWHDLPAAYAKLGYRCEMLESGYKAHAPYRVVLDQSKPTYLWPPQQLSLFRRMEADLCSGLDAMRGDRAAIRSELKSAQEAGTQARKEADALRSEIAAIQARLDDLMNQLDQVVASAERVLEERDDLKHQVSNARAETSAVREQLLRSESALNNLRRSVALGLAGDAARIAELEHELHAERERAWHLASRQAAFIQRAKEYVRA